MDCSLPGSSVHGISMGFPRQEFWNCHFLLRGGLPNLGIKPPSPTWAGGFLSLEPPGKSPIVLLLSIYNVGYFNPGLPRWPSGKNLPASTAAAGRPEFDPWVRKIPWRRKWQPTPVFLPGESRGQRNLAGCILWGCSELDMTEHTYIHTHIFVYHELFTFIRFFLNMALQILFILITKFFGAP